MKIKLILLISFLFVIHGCSNNPQRDTTFQATHNKIALCGAGSKLTLTGSIQTKLYDLMKRDFSLTGSFSSEVKGHFFSRVKVSEEHAVKLYNSYVKCISGESSTEELLSIVASRYYKTNKFLKNNNHHELSVDLERSYEEYRKALKNRQQILAYEANKEFQEVLKKSQLKIDNQENEENEFIFQSLELTLKKPVFFFNGKLSITALDKRKSLQSCLIRIYSNFDGKTETSTDLQLRSGKAKVYKIINNQYFIHVIDNPAHDKCTIVTHKVT